MSALDASKPQVSVIIVSADSGPSLRDCVKSVLACTTPLEVLLIDNASSDSIPQAIARARESDPRFKVIYNHANLGFGPAVNRAAAQAHGEALLILNPDCLITQESLQRLLDVLASEKKAGLVGAVVCDAKGVPDPASFRRDPVLGRALATLLGRKGGVNAQNVPDQVIEAEAVSGAVMLMPLRVFELLHGFDEKYFLHCEDLDLCRRVRDAGWRVLLAGDVRVLHGKGGSSRHRPVFVSYHKHRGMWRWFRKFDPASRNPLTAAVVWLGIWSRFLLKVPGQWLRAARR
jgi:GT2 family glycosyltransferase